MIGQNLCFAPSGLREIKIASASLIVMEIPSLRHITLEERHNEKDFSSVHLVQAYLARIKGIDEYRSILELNDDAESIARELDHERELTGRRG